METIVKWALSQHTVLPLKLQLDVVNWQLAKQDRPNLKLCLDWLFKKWNIRYQSLLEKKSKLFVYKSRTNSLENRNQENDVPDEDQIEVF